MCVYILSIYVRTFITKEEKEEEQQSIDARSRGRTIAIAEQRLNGGRQADLLFFGRIDEINDDQLEMRLNAEQYAQ